jgi:hypothetical protein
LCIRNKTINTPDMEHDMSVSRVHICLDTHDIITLLALSKCYITVNPRPINIQYRMSLFPILLHFHEIFWSPFNNVHPLNRNFTFWLTFSPLKSHSFYKCLKTLSPKENEYFP